MLRSVWTTCLLSTSPELYMRWLQTLICDCLYYSLPTQAWGNIDRINLCWQSGTATTWGACCSYMTVCGMLALSLVASICSWAAWLLSIYGAQFFRVILNGSFFMQSHMMSKNTCRHYLLKIVRNALSKCKANYFLLFSTYVLHAISVKCWWD